MFKNTSLKTRLILFVSLGIIVTAFIFMLYSTKMQKDLFTDSYTKKISGSLESVKLGIEIAFSKDEENYTIVNKVFETARQDKDLKFIALTFTDGELFASYPDEIGYNTNDLRKLIRNHSFDDPVYVMESDWTSERGSGKIFIGYSTEQVKKYEEQVLKDTVIIVLIFLLVSSIVVFLFAATITSPIQKLKESANLISSGNYNSRTVEGIGGSEIISVSKSFNRMVDMLINTQNELEGELKEAGDFVLSLLPAPIDSDIKIDWRFIPSKELGGDSFGYHYIDDTNLAVYLVDVSGHGVGSALHSISILNILRSQSLPNTDFDNPAHVLKSLNRIFQMDKHGDKYFTIWYGVLNLQTCNLRFSSAGHPPALLVGNSAVQKMLTENFFIGAFPDTGFDMKEIEVSRGQKLFVFSDGLYEFIKPDGKAFQFDELSDVVNVLENSTADELDILINKMKSISCDDTFNDDCSIISIYIK